MALVVYPLNDIDYTAEDAALYHSTRTSGVYAGDDFSFSLTGADNTITLGPGLAWMRIGKFFGVVVALKNELAVDMGIPDATYPRIDALILRYDANQNGGEIAVKQGIAASSPQPPERSTTEALYELHLLHVRREPGAVAVTAADVTDLRLNANYCGLMADSVTQVDTTAINAQIAALISRLQEEIAAVKGGTAYVMKPGDTMTGPLAMGGNKITDLGTPTASGDAVNKSYVDTKTVTATLAAASWVGSTAPYSQSITVAGLTDAKRAHAHPVYSGTLSTDLGLKEACACISYAKRSGTTVTFYCLEEKPSVNIPVEVEVSV